MYPTSSALDKLVKGSHTIVSLVDVHEPLPESKKIYGPLLVESGFVRVDRDNAIRRRFTGNLKDYTGSLTPKTAADLLHPFSSNELRVYRGVIFPDGTQELVPQGVFDIADSNVSDTGEDFRIEIQGYDRSRAVQRRRFTTNYQIGAGTKYDDAIMNMIKAQHSAIQFKFDSVDFLTPKLTWGGTEETGGGNAWDAGLKMAESIGHELLFDVDGFCVLQQVPSARRDHVHWHYHETDEHQTPLLFVEKRLSNEGVRNHIVVFGQNTSNSTPIKGEATDDDETSPTYINGPFGDIPGFERSEFIRTTAQANEFAEAVLRQKKGIEETVQVISIVHPGHDSGDILHIKRDRVGVDAEYILDSFTMPLEAGQSLNMNVRRQT